MKKQKSIGLTVSVLPTVDCVDQHCPFHTGFGVRGREFTGTVIKANAQKTVTMEFVRLFFLPKYERYEKRRTRIKAHVPDCLNVELGDKIRVIETRPISKTKTFVVIEVIK